MGIDHSQNFGNRTNQQEIIDQLKLNDALHINEKQTTIGYHWARGGKPSICFNLIIACQDTIHFADYLTAVGYQRIGDSFYSTR